MNRVYWRAWKGALELARISAWAVFAWSAFIPAISYAADEIHWDAVNAEDAKKIDVNDLDREVRTVVEELPGQEAVDLTPQEIRRSTRLVVKTLLLGHGRKTHDQLEAIVRKLAIVGDKETLSIGITAEPKPSIIGDFTSRPVRIEISMGLLGIVRTEDELAWAIAHNLSLHNDKAIGKGRTGSEIEGILKKMESMGVLESQQKQFVRADVGATVRLVQAGYNPWGGQDFIERLAQFKNGQFSDSFSPLLPELRSTVLKATFLQLSSKKNLNPLTRVKKPLPLDLRTLRAKALLWSSLCWSANTGLALGRMFLKASPILAALVAFLDWKTGFHLGEMIFHSLGIHGHDRWILELREAQRMMEKPNSAADAAAMLATIKSAAVKIGKVIGAWAAKRATYWSPDSRITELLEKIDSKLTLLARGRGNSRPALDQLLTRWSLVSDLFELERDYPSYGKGPRGWLNTIQTKKIWQTRALLADLERIKKSNLSDDNFFKRLGRVAPGLLAHPEIRKKVAELLAVSLIQRDFSKPLIAQLKPLTEAREKSSVREERFKAQFRILAFLVDEDNWSAADFLEYANIQKLEVDLAVSKGDIEGWWIGEWNTTPLRERAALVLLTKWIQGEISPESERKIFEQIRDTMLHVDWSDRFASSLSELLPRIGRLPIGRRVQIKQVLETIIFVASKTSLPVWKRARPILDTLEAEVDVAIDREVKSLEGLEKWANLNLPEGERRVPWRKALWKALVRHPEWITGPREVETILNHEDFWPIASLTEEMPEVSRGLISSYAHYARSLLRRSGEKEAIFSGRSERLQALLLRRLKELSAEPKSFARMFKLWQSMSRVGVSAVTEDLFGRLVSTADPEQIKVLESVALEKGLISDPLNHARIVEKQIRQTDSWKHLSTLAPGELRLKALQVVLLETKDLMPGRGLHYDALLERISREIRTTQAESTLVHAAKGLQPGNRSGDVALNSLTVTLDTSLGWTSVQQWDLLKFLRGDMGPTAFLEAQFEPVGLLRVRRDFQALPIDAKAVLLENYLASTRGLLSPTTRIKGSQMIANHLLGGGANFETSQDILEAFLYSMRKAGNSKLEPYVLAYLLSQPGGDAASPGRALKNVLEYFGATGVKLGQFLAASGMLPEKETEILSELQSRSKIPDRDEIYQDLEAIFAKLGKTEIPYEIDRVLGAASMKYAVLAREKATGRIVVLKILRETAASRLEAEFDQLDAMVEYLIKKHGTKYGVFASLVGATKRAVTRERSLVDEVARSDVARQMIYSGRSDSQIHVEAPRDRYISDRLIEADFAPGMPISDLPPEDQARFSRKILEMEKTNLRDAKETYWLNPDAHMGNFLAERTQDVKPGHKPRLSPIDFGQLFSITAQDLEKVERLFALSQILRETGRTEGIIQEIVRLTGGNAQKLRAALTNYFPMRGALEITAYFGLLTAIEASGATMSLSEYEYIRAILQQPRYERAVGTESGAPTAHGDFAIAVKRRADAYISEMKLNWLEKGRYGASRLMETWRSTPRGCLYQAMLETLKRLSAEHGVRTP